MALTELPIWDVPHEFLIWQPRLRRVVGPTGRAFSYGLLLPQLANLNNPAGAREVAERWGLEGLVSLAKRRREELHVPGDPPLAELADGLYQAAYWPPLDEETLAKLESAGLPRPPPEVPAPLLDGERLRSGFHEFAQTDGMALVEWFGFRSLRGRKPPAPSQQLAGGLLTGLHLRLPQVASEGARVSAGGFRDLVWSVYESLTVPRGVQFVRERSGGTERRAPAYRDLAERAALEIDHLLTLEPRLARCRLCGRIFVPARSGTPEQHCRQNLWLGEPPSYRMLERCLPAEGKERERIRKMLDQRYRRALARHGGDRKHAEVRKAQDRYNGWLAANPPAPRGRRPEARATFVPSNDGEAKPPASAGNPPPPKEEKS